MQVPINLAPSSKPVEGPIVGVLISRDLIFTTKITGTANALGYRFAVAGGRAPALKTIEEAKPKVVFLDLSAAELGEPEAVLAYRTAAGSTTPIIAFGPHVEVAALNAARQAGCREVMPRSRFTAELPDLIRKYCDAAQDEGAAG